MLLGLGFLCLTLLRNMDPLVRDMAVSGAKNAVSAAMQKSVAGRMAAGELTGLVELMKDDAGQVTAAVTDVGRVSQLQAALAGGVSAALTAPAAANLGVPLGNLLPSPFFSGMGPRVPIRILSVSEVEVKLMSRFTSAGINQTLHRITLQLTGTVRIVLPGRSYSVTVSTQAPVAENVIVGDVPEAYTNVANTDDLLNLIPENK